MSSPETIVRFLTSDELLTLTGSVSAVFVISQSLWYALGWPQKYVGLILSLLIAFYGVIASGDYSLHAWVVAVPNGFIIYSSTAGIASMTGNKRRSKGRSNTNKPRDKGTRISEEVSIKRRSFWTPWFDSE